MRPARSAEQPSRSAEIHPSSVLLRMGTWWTATQPGVIIPPRYLANLAYRAGLLVSGISSEAVAGPTGAQLFDHFRQHSPSKLDFVRLKGYGDRGPGLYVYDYRRTKLHDNEREYNEARDETIDMLDDKFKKSFIIFDRRSLVFPSTADIRRLHTAA